MSPILFAQALPTSAAEAPEFQNVPDVLPHVPEQAPPTPTDEAPESQNVPDVRLPVPDVRLPVPELHILRWGVAPCNFLRNQCDLFMQIR